MTSVIAGKSATRKNKFTASQWAALLVFSGVEIRKQVQNILREVLTIAFTEIKGPQIDVFRQCIQVWLGDDVAEDI